MFRAKHKDNSKEVYRWIEKAGWEGILRATVYFWQTVQQVLNVNNPPPYKTPSAPGEPPRKRTGFGQSNVIYETDRAGMRTRVGVLSNAKYLATLELFRNRPWLMATLRKVWPKLKALVSQPPKGKP
ncbi:MAG: hypothetical protein Q7R45_17655 [Sulfuricaulis sp.]|nr:hypothetical protein [Sulfuricaulis sp.]